MESHQFWALFVIALIAGAAIALAVNNATMTGEVIGEIARERRPPRRPEPPSAAPGVPTPPITVSPIIPRESLLVKSRLEAERFKIARETGFFFVLGGEQLLLSTDERVLYVVHFGEKDFKLLTAGVGVGCSCKGPGRCKWRLESPTVARCVPDGCMHGCDVSKIIDIETEVRREER